MKLLTYNSLDKCYSNHQIKGDIALHSIFIELLSSILSLTEEAMITYQQKIFNDEDLDAYINPSKKKLYHRVIILLKILNHSSKKTSQTFLSN